MVAEYRFPQLKPGALATTINNVPSIPLTAHDAVAGALTLYSHRVNAFDADTDRLVQALSDYGRRREDQLEDVEKILGEAVTGIEEWVSAN